MISLILKNWRFLLDAILIIALVVLIFLWNPFGIFGGGLKLGTTTNMVTEIREIGQLVTAEYYGEVIASIDESRLSLIKRDSVDQRANLMYADLKLALYNLYQFQQLPREERIREYKENKDLYPQLNFLNWGRIFKQDVDRKNILAKLEHHNPDFRQTNLYGEVIEYLWREQMGNDEKETWDVKERHEEQVLFMLYNDVAQTSTADSAGLQVYLSEGFENDQNFIAFYDEDFTSELPRVEQKKKLAMVGRGWVKAGFDFGTLDEQSFYFHEESSELHLFGFEPKILNADINPWFIPEKGIPGFEIIDYNGRVDFKDAKKVKEFCIQKLTLYAHRADIISNAQKQGEETLKSFFSLLTGKEVKKVHFHNDRLVQIADEIAQDEFVNYYEAQLLDSLIREEIQLIDSLRETRFNRSNNLQKIQIRQNLLKSTIGRLRKLPFEDMDTPFGYYSAAAYRIALDQTLDPQERKALEEVRWNNLQQPDTLPLNLWYEDSLSFMMEYNAALSYLMEKSRWMESTIDTVFALEDSISWREEVDSAYTVLDNTWSGDSLRLSLSRSDTITQPQYLLSLLHPFHYQKDTFTSIARSRTLLGAEVSSTKDTTLSADLHLWIYNTESAEVMQSLSISPEHFINKHILAQSKKGLQADSLYFIFNTEPLNLPLVTSEFTAVLNDTQTQEIIRYYQLLKHQHEVFRNKGAIVRASEWVQAKLSDRKSLEFSFAEVKEYLEN